MKNSLISVDLAKMFSRSVLWILNQVKPFVIGNKNDHNDAIAIAEASRRPKASFVPVKSLEQQDLQSLQRIRERMMKHRTAIGNLSSTTSRSVRLKQNSLRWLRKDYQLLQTIPTDKLSLWLKALSSRAHPCKEGHCRLGQQDGTDSLGSAGNRQSLSGYVSNRLINASL
jgi:transposase